MRFVHFATVVLLVTAVCIAAQVEIIDKAGGTKPPAPEPTEAACVLRVSGIDFRVLIESNGTQKEFAQSYSSTYLGEEKLLHILSTVEKLRELGVCKTIRVE